MTPGAIQDFYDQLRTQLTKSLPGLEAQRELAIISRRMFASQPKQAKKAGVCAVIYPSSDSLRLAFIQRTMHEKDRHSGQISFPGGQMEDQDDNLQVTAVRELEEETGIMVKPDQVLGSLTPLYIPVSNYIVHPFVIGLGVKPTIWKQDDEVAEIFGCELDKLLKLPIQRKAISGQGFTIPDAPYFDLDGKTLWGATAMMTNELLKVIRLL